ncbi:MAG: STAS domain-containing protein [Sporichthyaceae bacterium]
MIPAIRSSQEDFGTVDVYGRLLLAKGEFDAGNAEVLRAALAEVSRSPDGFIVDLTGVAFLDSSAIRTVWDVVPLAPTVLVATGSLVARLCQITGLHRVADLRFVEPPESSPPR